LEAVKAAQHIAVEHRGLGGFRFGAGTLEGTRRDRVDRGV
jgi:hypothetical protein